MSEASTEPRARSQRINIRPTARQETLLRLAASATDRTMTDFILNSAVAHAEQVLADRRWFAATDEQFEAFLRALDAPLPSHSKLEALLARESRFSDPV